MCCTVCCRIIIDHRSSLLLLMPLFALSRGAIVAVSLSLSSNRRTQRSQRELAQKNDQLPMQYTRRSKIQARIPTVHFILFEA